MTVSIPTPLWLRVLIYCVSPRYRRDWQKLEQRSHVTGTAREETVVCRFWGHRLVVSRQIERKDRGR